MRKSLKYLLIVTLFFTLFEGCKKYPQGPSISFRSKAARVEGEWKIEKYLFNNVDQTNVAKSIMGSDFVWDIQKDGKYHLHGTNPIEGKWKFTDDKTTLTFTADITNPQDAKYLILRLKNKELWLKIIDIYGDTHEWHLNQ